MTILLVDNAHTQRRATFYPQLREALASLTSQRVVEARTAAEVSALDPRAVTGVVLSGGPMLLTDRLCVDAYAANLAALALFGDRPVLGVCFGMQVMVKVFGGALSRLGARRSGQRELCAVPGTRSSLLRGVPRRACFASAFVDATSAVPPGFRVVAETTDGLPAAIERGRLYAIQYHPEASGEHGRRVLANFVAQCV